MEKPIWLQRKLIEPSQLENKILELRSSGKSIGTLNGSFDLLHAGHLYIIYEASKQADVLIVLLNSDQSVQKYKSPLRPIIPLMGRLSMMAALEFVHYLTWFEETDPRDILRRIKPDVHVNGSEYGEHCIESTVVKEQGGRLYLVPRIPHLSTSEIIAKVKACG